MGLQQVVWGVTVVIFVFCKGCHSQEPACGMAKLSGPAAGPGGWPWHVSLNVSGSVFCGGSLISNQWILTAASCISYADLNTTIVHLGRRNMSGSNPNEVTRTLADIDCHPYYNWYTYENDICLLKLSTPVNFNTHVQPICLASADSTFYNGTSSWVTGYGSTDFYGYPVSGQQEMKATIIGNNQCECYHQPKTVTSNMICARHLGAEWDICQGDSGGPLMSKNGSAFVQSGIVSWGTGCGTPQSPGVYTRVSSYYQWINDTVTGMRPGFVSFMSTGFNSDLYFTCPSPSPATPDPPFPTFPPFPPFPPRPCSFLACAGENLIHFTNFIALSILALVLHAFVGSG